MEQISGANSHALSLKLPILWVGALVMALLALPPGQALAKNASQPKETQVKKLDKRRLAGKAPKTERDAAAVDKKILHLLNNVLKKEYPTPKHRLTSKSIMRNRYAKPGGFSFPKVRRSGRLVELIQRASRKHGLDKELVYAVVETESGFNQHAVSNKGAQGLMQIMPETAKAFGLRKPFDPAANIDVGVRFLKLMIKKYRKLPLALAAYNAGPATVDRYKGVPPFKETQYYIARIMTRYSMLKRAKL